ncbi:MAG: hypothetical protein M0019_10685 [Actinomycetota bacterium]|nr:hypothetical protein [Actinomycetota bacterium]
MKVDLSGGEDRCVAWSLRYGVAFSPKSDLWNFIESSDLLAPGGIADGGHVVFRRALESFCGFVSSFD